MTFKVRLKAGFFKTRPYLLSFSDGQLILTPGEKSEGSCLVVRDRDLKSIGIKKGGHKHAELEIITLNGVIIGNLAPHTDLEEVYKEVAREFGHKFTGIY